jgi:hypothetical protein
MRLGVGRNGERGNQDSKERGDDGSHFHLGLWVGSISSEVYEIEQTKFWTWRLQDAGGLRLTRRRINRV